LFDKRAEDSWASLASELLTDLASEGPPEGSVRAMVRRALAAFAADGAQPAQELARKALDMAEQRVSALGGRAEASSSDARRKLLAILRDLDIALLQASVLPSLLALDRKSAETHLVPPAVAELHERLSDLLLGWQAASDRAPVVNVELRLLRSLIHLLDADAELGDPDPGERAKVLRQRWLRAAQTLGARLERGAPQALTRSLLAALARALDGLVRSEMCEAADVLLWVAWHVSDVHAVVTLSEASRDPDLVGMLTQWAAVASVLSSEQDVQRKLDAFAAFGGALSGDSSSREQAVRDVLLRLGRTLQAVHDAKGISDLACGALGATSPMGHLDAVTTLLAQLVTAARRRLEDSMDEAAPRSVATGMSAVELATDRAAAGDSTGWAKTLGWFVRDLWNVLPSPIVSLVKDVLRTIVELPRRSKELAPRSVMIEAPLPAWIPSRRTIGGFYVVRPIGAGALGSVFVAKRIEERHDERAELFALKVPVYDPRAARHLSEAEFLSMFQSEASALLTLPSHPGLARFVTFDLGAKPKPILVMELVDGITLERVVDTGQLTCARALSLLEGVLAGLEAMHRVGVGHLDLKPSNVILRAGEQPVIVDFGLAGRHIRPGCGSGCYGAPEIWGLETPEPPSPMSADVYAVACLAFELFSGRTMFHYADATSLLAAHLAHDGWPAPLLALRQRPATGALAEVLASALRRDFRQRISVSALGAELTRLSPTLASLPWPIQA
jgi:hypothetical protein